MSVPIVAYWEKPSMAGRGTGMLRKEYRVRPIKSVDKNDYPVDWWRALGKSNPWAEWLLEYRYIRDGVDEGWQAFGGYQTRNQALEDVDPQSVSIDRGLKFINEKRANENKRARERAEEDARRRAAADERMYHQNRSQDAFAKLQRSKDGHLADAWQTFAAEHQNDEALRTALTADRTLYDAVMNAETVPAKRAAIKAFLAKYTAPSRPIAVETRAVPAVVPVHPVEASARSAHFLPPVGTTIEKRDRAGNVRASCQVLADGIAYNGKKYASLSSAAMAAMADLGLKATAVNGWAWWDVKAAGGGKRRHAAVSSGRSAHVSSRPRGGLTEELRARRLRRLSRSYK